MDNSSYFNNVISIRVFSMKTMLKDLRNAVDKER